MITSFVKYSYILHIIYLEKLNSGGCYSTCGAQMDTAVWLGQSCLKERTIRKAPKELCYLCRLLNILRRTKSRKLGQI
jgi:hypothetical protein